MQIAAHARTNMSPTRLRGESQRDTSAGLRLSSTESERSEEVSSNLQERGARGGRLCVRARARVRRRRRRISHLESMREKQDRKLP